MDGLSHIQSVITFAWWIALDLSVLLYILLDGADLGAGIFSLFVRSHHERGAIMSAMAGTMRGYCAVITQQTHLFNTSIRENLRIAARRQGG
jgi:predicted PurR-regulated permease PerM